MADEAGAAVVVVGVAEESVTVVVVLLLAATVTFSRPGTEDSCRTHTSIHV